MLSSNGITLYRTALISSTKNSNELTLVSEGCGLYPVLRDCLLGSIMKRVENGKKDLLLAAEVQVKRSACHPGAPDDVRDAGAPISFARKSPCGGVQQLLSSNGGRQKGPALLI